MAVAITRLTFALFFFPRLTLSANLSSADYFFPSLLFPRTHAAELTFVLAFKWSNFLRAVASWGRGEDIMWRVAGRGGAGANHKSPLCLPLVMGEVQ